MPSSIRPQIPNYHENLISKGLSSKQKYIEQYLVILCRHLADESGSLKGLNQTFQTFQNILLINPYPSIVCFETHFFFQIVSKSIDTC